MLQLLNPFMVVGFSTTSLASLRGTQICVSFTSLSLNIAISKANMIDPDQILHKWHLIFGNTICSFYCLACKAEARHMYCFSGVIDNVNFCQVFAFRSFSQKL